MDFEQKLQQLIVKLEGHPDKQNQLKQIQLTIYKTGEILDEYYELIEQLQNSQQTQQKQYIYNKTGQLTRSRQCRQTIQQYCLNCQSKLNSFLTCQVCGQRIVYESTSQQKPQNKIQKIKQFMTYFQGISPIPYFVNNYVNNVLLQEQIQQSENTFAFKFPFQIQTINKKRSDIQKKQFQIDEYQQKQIYIPNWTFKEFKNIMKKYREMSKQWPNSSYLPRDAIYLSTIYVNIFDLKYTLFSEEDKQSMIEQYEKILSYQHDRKNDFTIFHILTGFILYIPQFQKYSNYLNLVKNVEINQELKKIILNE